MRVVHVSYADAGGGAANIAHNLHDGLRAAGVDSRMVVGVVNQGGAGVHGPVGTARRLWTRVAGELDQVPLRRYPSYSRHDFSPAWLGSGTVARVDALAPDVVHLHWINAGYLRPESLGAFRAPVVWTLHDMWPFSGGCHFSFGCERYRERCGACPLLGSDRERDLSRRLWRRKRRSWRDLDLHVCACSESFAAAARESSLFRDKPVTCLYNGIDVAAFAPRARARDWLDLPPGRKVVLFGAIGATSDRRKGFQLLQPALQRLGADRDDCQALVFGTARPAEAPELGMPVSYLGRFAHPRALSLVYAAADVMVLPSMAETLPTTALESQACETPVVCFDVPGVRETVEDGVDGLRAAAFEPEDLATKIGVLLDDDGRRREMGRRAREKVERTFSVEAMTARYLEYYEAILASDGAART